MHIIKKCNRLVPVFPKELADGEILKIIKKRLYDNIVGTTFGTVGMIVDVSKIEDIGRGYIESGGGGVVKYNVTYIAKIYSPKENELSYGSVIKLTPQGLLIRGDHGIEFYVADREMPNEYVYSGDEWKVPCDSSLHIRIGSYVQIRILGIRIDSSSIFGIATMKGDYLGLLRK